MLSAWLRCSVYCIPGWWFLIWKFFPKWCFICYKLPTAFDRGNIRTITWTIEQRDIFFLQICFYKSHCVAKGSILHKKTDSSFGNHCLICGICRFFKTSLYWSCLIVYCVFNGPGQQYTIRSRYQTQLYNWQNVLCFRRASICGYTFKPRIIEWNQLYATNLPPAQTIIHW